MKGTKTPNSRTYTGHSGQMAVMAELLFRECNVEIPDVDVGTDVVVFLDDREEDCPHSGQDGTGEAVQGPTGL